MDPSPDPRCKDRKNIKMRAIAIPLAVFSSH